LAAAGELHLDALVDELRQVECSLLAPSLTIKQAAPLNLASRATIEESKQVECSAHVEKGRRRLPSQHDTRMQPNPSRGSSCLHLRAGNRRESRADFRPSSRCGRRSSGGRGGGGGGKLAEKKSSSPSFFGPMICSWTVILLGHFCLTAIGLFFFRGNQSARMGWPTSVCLHA